MDRSTRRGSSARTNPWSKRTVHTSRFLIPLLQRIQQLGPGTHPAHRRCPEGDRPRAEKGCAVLLLRAEHALFDELSISRVLGKGYTEWFRKISRVHHADEPDVWQERLERAGFELVRWWHYFSPACDARVRMGTLFRRSIGVRARPDRQMDHFADKVEFVFYEEICGTIRLTRADRERNVYFLYCKKKVGAQQDD